MKTQTKETKLKKGICPCCNKETISEDQEGYYCDYCDIEYNKPKKRFNEREWVKE